MKFFESIQENLQRINPNWCQIDQIEETLANSAAYATIIPSLSFLRASGIRVSPFDNCNLNCYKFKIMHQQSLYLWIKFHKWLHVKCL